MTKDELLFEVKQNIKPRDLHGNTYRFQIGRNGFISILMTMFDGVSIYIGKLGVINGKLRYFKKEDLKHIHRATNGWSINYHIYSFVDQVVFRVEEEAVDYCLNTDELRPVLEGNNVTTVRIHKYASNPDSKVYVPMKYWTKLPIK